MKKIVIFLSFLYSFIFADIDFEKSQLSELKKVAMEDHRKLFIFISSNNCKYCSKQKELILSDESIFYKIYKYDAFHINKDIEFESTIDVPVTPAIIIFNEKNEELVRYYGYQDRDSMNQLLDEYINNKLEE